MGGNGALDQVPVRGTEGSLLSHMPDSSPHHVRMFTELFSSLLPSTQDICHHPGPFFIKTALNFSMLHFSYLQNWWAILNCRDMVSNG